MKAYEKIGINLHQSHCSIVPEKTALLFPNLLHFIFPKSLYFFFLFTIYICPLCKQAFFKESLSQELENPLTLEDVPPVSLGGRPLILTCKKCNNSAGTKLDKPLVNHLKESSFLKLQHFGQVKGKVWINDLKKVPTVIKIGKTGELIFQVDFKNTIVKQQFKEFESANNEININFEFSTTKTDLVKSALLRIGYLLAFNYLGNQLLIDGENIDPIINQISNPEKRILPHSSVSELKISDDIKDGLNILMEPKCFKSYFAVFTLLINNNRRQFGVFLPGPGKDGWQMYENIVNFKKSTEMTFKNISFREMIKDKKLVCGYNEIWANTHK